MIDPTTLSAWRRLSELATTVGRESLRTLTERRLLMARGGPLVLDYTRQRVDKQVMHGLFELAEQVGLADMRSALMAGEVVNNTEHRAALHTALRGERDRIGAASMARGEFERMAQFADGVRSGAIRGSANQQFRSVVNIGIGGSDLGPRLVYEALQPYCRSDIDVHFVSNVDPDALLETLRGVDPASTLIIIASKTFTTAETMANAERARTWLTAALGPNAVESHMVALSTAAERVAAFGINPDLTFGFWDWVGGRYSVFSAIGLADMIAIGPAAFRALLDGAASIDDNFAEAPNESNLPVLLGLLGVWNRSFLGIPTVAVLPYAHRLRSFPEYLQQLVMESNGKSVRRDGASVTYRTSPVIWGQAGTNGQHSFHQFLHQGTDDVACDLLVFAQGSQQDLQQTLIAHALAQAEVLAFGRSAQAVADSHVEVELQSHLVMPGNRPTNIILARTLDPFTLGALIALYEHAVFVQAVVWGINPFDQWGVELGKVLAGNIERAFTAGDVTELDPVTQHSIELLRDL